MKTILVSLEDEKEIESIAASFHDLERIDSRSEWPAILEAIRISRYDFVFLDLGLLGSKVGEKISELLRIAPTLQIIVLAQQDQFRSAMQAIKAGARDYITYPVSPEEFRVVTDNVDETVRLESELDFLRDEFWRKEFLEEVRSDSPVMQSVFGKVRSVAPTRSTVLLTGETGSGKSILARMIHLHSSRLDKQFIAVHCGAIPDTLLESELFGHERGAFTGATRRKLGKFEIAEGGTLFLDEIGTISHSAQIKLLQVLQDRTFQRLGSENSMQCDIRIIAATNVDLKALCDQGLFRKDLYYRLNVFPLEIPPLRDRKEDIPHLTNLFIDRLSPIYLKEVGGIHSEVLEAFAAYDWPGNIRELENLIERAFVLESTDVLRPESFPAELFGAEGRSASPSVDLDRTLADVRSAWASRGERQYLGELLKFTKGKIAPAAAKAGITTRQLNKLMHKHALKKEEFKA